MNIFTLLNAAQKNDYYLMTYLKPQYQLKSPRPHVELTETIIFHFNLKKMYISNLLVSGDELIDLTDFHKYWILHSGVDGGIAKVQVIDEEGNPLATTKHKFRLIRSGHREIVQAPAEVITMLRNPLEYDNVYKSVPNAVIGAQAFEFYDHTQLYTNNTKCIYIKCSEPEVGEIEVNLSEQPGDGFTPYCFNSNSSSIYQVGSQINPYFLGIKGIWRKGREWNYYDRTNTTFARDQKQDNPYDPNTTNIRTAGTIAEYYPFWSHIGSSWINNNSSQYWISTEWMTQADNLGNTLESSNPLELRNSTLFGYNKMLAIAIANNSKYSEMLFDGFEDYEVNDAPWLICQGNQPVIMGPAVVAREEKNIRHWPLWKAMVDGSLKITKTISHTGWQSIKIDANKSATIPIDNKNTGIALNGDWLPYKLVENDFISNFYPSPNTYSITFWYKAEKNKFQLEIIDPLGNPIVLKAGADNGTMIDGWKKADYTFTVSSGSEKISFKFINSSTTEALFLDDFRVLPEKAVMKSFVYDKMRYKLMATLDENNYATFFEYNPDGSLARTKAETEKGIVTLSSGKSNIKK